jgi:hypothetical protein
MRNNPGLRGDSNKYLKEVIVGTVILTCHHSQGYYYRIPVVYLILILKYFIQYIRYLFIILNTACGLNDFTIFKINSKR